MMAFNCFFKEDACLPVEGLRIIRGIKNTAASGAAFRGYFRMPFQVIFQAAGEKRTLGKQCYIRRQVLLDLIRQ